MKNLILILFLTSLTFNAIFSQTPDENLESNNEIYQVTVNIDPENRPDNVSIKAFKLEDPIEEDEIRNSNVLKLEAGEYYVKVEDSKANSENTQKIFQNIVVPRNSEVNISFDNDYEKVDLNLEIIDSNNDILIDTFSFPVQIEGQNMVPAKGGKALFEQLDSKQQYIIKINHPEFEPFESMFYIRDENATELHQLKLARKKFPVSVKVVHKRNKRKVVSGCKVTVFDEDGGWITGKTNEAGLVILKNVTKGYQKIKAEYPEKEFLTAEEYILVRPGNERVNQNEIQLQLIPKIRITGAVYNRNVAVKKDFSKIRESKVTVKLPNGDEYPTTTDEMGHFLVAIPFSEEEQFYDFEMKVEHEDFETLVVKDTISLREADLLLKDVQEKIKLVEKTLSYTIKLKTPKNKIAKIIVDVFGIGSYNLGKQFIYDPKNPPSDKSRLVNISSPKNGITNVTIDGPEKFSNLAIRVIDSKNREKCVNIFRNQISKGEWKVSKDGCKK